MHLFWHTLDSSLVNQNRENHALSEFRRLILGCIKTKLSDKRFTFNILKIYKIIHIHVQNSTTFRTFLYISFASLKRFQNIDGHLLD